ncbi:MAG: hypothetical protein ABI042_00300 [Verrucomicrobiota bacterium]
MRNEAGDIVQDQVEDLKQLGQEWKDKARAAGNAAWDATCATYQQLSDKTIEYSKATDKVIREKPYAAIGIAFGVGVAIGLLAMCGREDDEY